jgi:hypothetical protein
MSSSYTSSPHKRLHGVYRDCFAYFYFICSCFTGSRGSSVSVVYVCILDARAIGIRSPAEAEDFSCNLCVQTASDAHPVFYPMGTESPFPWVKGGRGVKLTIHPYPVPRSRMSRSFFSPFQRLHDLYVVGLFSWFT